MPQDDELVTQLTILYRAAGQPSFRRISNDIREREEMPDTVSHETVSGLLSGEVMPRWSKVECVVRILAEMAAHQPDPQVEVRRFLALWTTRNDSRASSPAIPAITTASGSITETLPVEPSNVSIPPRNPSFTGREELLQVMRTRLDGEPWQPLILHGLSGVGKTSIATEFVHREMESHRYDAVWWIVAEQVARTRSTLAAVGERPPLELELSQSDMRQTVNYVLGELERATFSWLIVFDNAGSPDQIRELLPAGRGAVIVTTRDGTWSRHGRTVSVDVLPRRDSIALLQSRGSIAFDDADQLAERLGDLPLALEQASAMRTASGISVDAYLRRLDRHATSVLSEGRPSDYPDTVASAFGLTYDEVRRESPGAGQLLAMLSCLSAEPVSIALLRSADERAIQPPLGRLLTQPTQLDAAVELLERFGLLRTVDSAQKVEVHRLVQLIVRDSLTPHDVDRAYLNARRLLVAANPGRPDDPLTWEMHGQIGPHLGPARLVEDADRDVRRVVLDHVRYLYLLGDFDGCLRLSEAARKAWAGRDDRWEDDETFACIDRLALALVGLGRYRDANALYDEAWVRLNSNERFGPGHDRTARTASGVAMVSRILGGYGKALNLERYRVEHYSNRGDDEPASRERPEVLRARLNLAVCYRAIGDFARAREIDDDLVAIWRQLEGDDDYRTQLAISNLARDLYGLGEYADALQLQQDSLAVLRQQLNNRHPNVVLANRTVAIALRKTGQVVEALRTSREHHLVCQGEWGSDHGHTLAAAMTYANAIRAAVAVGQAGGLTYSHAYNTSLRAVSTYRARFGEANPLTLAAAVNHAIILRATGERNTARRTTESAYRLLLDQVGAAHPYTHAAAVELASDLSAQHDDEGAARLLRATLESARLAQRDQHPDMLICAVNLGLLTRSWDPAAGQGLFDKGLNGLRTTLGPDHPQVLAVSRAERGVCDIEPPPF
ncbi:MAG TPA: FxSxx-COOH system tetratricopeptide repeat protein [Actinoplanes sp.]|nr:FxSxx-COOH system tetratricopeptide repeat protein [Actinoplanes sp.]